MVLKTRESNRLKYRSGFGSGSRNFIFNGLVPVQVQDFSKTWVQVWFGFSCTKIYTFGSGSSKPNFLGSGSVQVH